MILQLGHIDFLKLDLRMSTVNEDMSVRDGWGCWRSSYGYKKLCRGEHPNDQDFVKNLAQHACKHRARHAAFWTVMSLTPVMVHCYFSVTTVRIDGDAK